VEVFLDILIIGALIFWGGWAGQRRRARSEQSSQHPPGWTPPPGDTPALPYRAAPSLLTPTEAAFHAVLRQAVGPQAVIQCKVRLADILHTQRGDMAAFRRVSQKHVDFVLCQPESLKSLLAVELDDRSHDRPDRQDRDRFVDQAYKQAGLAVLHVPVRHEYDPAAVLALVQPHLLPDWH